MGTLGSHLYLYLPDNCESLIYPFRALIKIFKFTSLLGGKQRPSGFKTCNLLNLLHFRKLPEALGQGHRWVLRWVRDVNHHFSAEGTSTTFKQQAGTDCKGINSNHILLQILHLTWVKLGKTVCVDPQELGFWQPAVIFASWSCTTSRCSFLPTHKQLEPLRLLLSDVRKCSFTFPWLLIFFSTGLLHT